MKRLNRHYFDDMLNYAKDAINFTENITYEAFTNDKKTKFAAVRAIEGVGEASNRIPEEIKEKYSNIPWHKMLGLRNKIVHNYDEIDYTIVWNILENDIPQLISQVENIFDEVE